MSLEVYQVYGNHQGSGQIILQSVRLQIRISPSHPLVCRKWRLNLDP
jgi:hypothetical protein